MILWFVVPPFIALLLGFLAGGIRNRYLRWLGVAGVIGVAPVLFALIAVGPLPGDPGARRFFLLLAGSPLLVWAVLALAGILIGHAKRTGPG